MAVPVSILVLVPDLSIRPGAGTRTVRRQLIVCCSTKATQSFSIQGTWTNQICHPCGLTTKDGYSIHSRHLSISRQYQKLSRYKNWFLPNWVFQFYWYLDFIMFLFREFWQDKFNWTMTYRRDSDIIHRYPYGALVAGKTMRKSYGKSRPTANSVQRRLPRKKKLIAWITSTCPTTVRRENYVRELSKHIAVDIYGGCGHKYCGSNEQVSPLFFSFETGVSVIRIRDSCLL